MALSSGPGPGATIRVRKGAGHDTSVAPDPSPRAGGAIRPLGGRDRRPRRRYPAGHLLERRGADLPVEMPGMPSARLDRADVADHLPAGAAVGALDQGARRRTPDAAVAH